MPHVTLQISAVGPVLDLMIGVSVPREKALRQAQVAVPPPLTIRGLVDTGASGTAIDPDCLRALQLAPTGQIPIHTPSTGGQPQTFDQFDVFLRLLHPKLTRNFGTLPVISAKLAPQGIQALIGRDVLAECLLVYDGAAGIFSIAF